MNIAQVQQRIARERDVVSREWDSLNLPAWDDMTQEQRSKAVAMADRQGTRMARVKRELGLEH